MMGGMAADGVRGGSSSPLMDAGDDGPFVRVRLSEMSDPLLAELYRDLLEPNFPPHELLTYDELSAARSAETTGGMVLVASGRPVAGVITESYAAGRVLLVAYLVVAADLRGSQLGSRLLDEVRAEAARAYPPAVVLAEVEDPRYYAVSGGIDPAARLRFYARQGARLLPVDYVQPSLRPGSPRAENLLLIALTDEESVDATMLTQFLDEYFEACEGPDWLTAGENSFRQAREGLARLEGRALPLAPLGDLSVVRPAPSRAGAGGVGT
jgi:predicted N-acetyltransferase YhbS